MSEAHTVPGSSRSRVARIFASLFTTDHRTLGIRYLLLSLIAVAAGTLLSLAMRIQLAWPGIPFPRHGPMLPEEYLSLVTMHGTLMVFFVLTTAPQSGFASLVLPAQIGARRMALPWLNAAGFWIVALALVVLLSAFLLPAGGPISGWTSYPPLSAVPAAGPGQGAGMDVWLVSIGLFCIGSWLSAVNMLATIVGERVRGMTLGRMPLTVWSWMVSSLLILLAFTVLFAALVLLLCDRHIGTAFFIPRGDLVSGQIVGHGDGSPLLWLHLFWFFGHPEVYIAILPAMGLVSGLVANFSRRTIVGYPLMAATTVLIGLLGFLVWGHHMFVSGMNPYAGNAFALTTMAIAVPSTAKVFSWLGTLWGGGLHRTTPMLFALGFISFFIAGGVTGPILALPALDAYLHNTFFVVGHFHLIMAMAGGFAIFAGVYYWFPLMTGRLMNERLGRWHFWLSLVAAYGTFLPMHLEGLAGRPRHYYQLTGSTSSLASLMPMERGVTWAAFVLGTAQLIFLANLCWSSRHGRPAGENPWQATTLEWAAATPSEIFRGPYEYGAAAHDQAQNGAHKQDFTSQWESLREQE